MPPEGQVPEDHEYLRVSRDASGRAKSNDQQHVENTADREAQGWAAGRTYADVGSASKYATKAREGFDQLLADLRGGQKFKPGDVLHMWESSRGSRKQAVWATLLDLLADAQVLVRITSHGRTYDLSNPRDRRSLDEDGTDSAYESAKTSKRIIRDVAFAAIEGKPHGRCPYGFTRLYDPRTGRLLAQEPEPAEAAVIRRLFRDLAKGRSFKSIARDFEARGIEKRSGGPFTGAHLRVLARTPAYAGLRVHIAGRSGNARWTEAQLTKATWPAIVPRAHWLAVQRLLDTPGRLTRRPGRGVHLLSRIGRCGECGGPLAAKLYKGTRPRHYICQDRGCVRVDADELDAIGEKVVKQFLARRDNYQPPEDVSGELEAVRTELAEARAEHRALADAGISLLLASMREPAILARIDKLEARERELEMPPELSGPLAPGPDIDVRWAGAEMAAKRRVAAVVLSARYVGVLSVLHSPVRGHRVPVEERIEFRRETA